MAGIDALYMENPCSVSSRLFESLAREGIPISCETSCAAWGYGRSVNTPYHCARLLASDFHVCWSSSRSGQRIRSARHISPISRARKDSSIWWRLWIYFLETCSAGRTLTAITRSSFSMPCRWHWQLVACQSSSTPIRAANSPLLI